MPATIATRPVHPQLPLDRVWQQGRRLYARCGQHSQLSSTLRALGAKWDTQAKALWVGTRKRAGFEQAALEHQERRERYEEIRAAGHWVTVPYQAPLIRDRVKQLGGVWLAEERQWALPTPADAVEITGLLDAWHQAREAERAEARRREEEWRRQAAERREIARRAAQLEAAGAREAQRRRAAEDANAYRRALAERLGRRLLGPVEVRREVFPRFTTRAGAHQAAPEDGSMVRLADGRRALVTDVQVRWVPREDAAIQGQQDAHWYAESTLAVLAPTEEELEAEAERARERMDAEELHAAVTDAAVLTFPAAGDRWSRLPEREGTITVTTGVNGLIPAGQVILTPDETVWWQHPGEYDTYVRAEGRSRDAGLVAAVRRLLRAGPRRRTLPRPDGPPWHYTVERPADA